MKKILLLMLAFTNYANAQQLYITPSLGWGYGLFQTGNFSETNNIAKSRVCYNSNLSFSNFLANPQTGYFLEFRINDNHSIGIGRMSGITEHRVSISAGNKYGYTLIGGLYRKLGATYSYNLNKLNFQIGLYYANNKISTVDSGGTTLISVNKDQMGVTMDSSFTGSYRIRKWGVTTSIGIGYSFWNHKKNRTRFNLNLLADIGWYKLTGVKDFILYDYNKTLTSYSYSNGSQVKIYISKPILIYDFKKDKYKLLK